jgi:hypothetical protein
MNYTYYYNDVPGVGQTRNNLVYTSLISNDKKVFVQWYYNDGVYHANQNEIVDPEKMEEKWNREVQFLQLMHKSYPNLIPNILDIDFTNKKIYLEIDGVDFWNRSSCSSQLYDTVLPNWQSQMIEIINAHKTLGLHKYSMHPSSYFIVNGQLKSINYFFTYHSAEPNISIKEVESHIHSNRQLEMKTHLNSLGIDWDSPQPWNVMDQLCWESFRKNYTDEFINIVRAI